MLSLLSRQSANKNYSNPFRIRIFLFLAYSFGIVTVNTFIHSVVPSKTIPDSRPIWAKCIPVFRPKRRKTPPRRGGTYLYGLYKGVPPPTPPGDNSLFTVGCTVDCEQSLFFFSFSESNARARERRSRETRETSLPSRAISHARGHLRVSRFARQTTEKRETARSLVVLDLIIAIPKRFLNVQVHSCANILVQTVHSPLFFPTVLEIRATLSCKHTDQ